MAGRTHATPSPEFRGREILSERDDVCGKSAQAGVLMTIGSPVPGSKQPRIDRMVSIEDGMAAGIAHDVQQQQARCRIGMLERVDRQAITGSSVGRRVFVLGLLVPGCKLNGIERPEVDVKRETDLVATDWPVRLVSAEEPMVLRCDPALSVNDLPLADQRSKFLQVFPGPDLLCKLRIKVHAQDSRSFLRQAQFFWRP